ncbi:MAG: hypothetical protein IKP28_00955 [Clostridia bacterium]|nr:hypothetical protein [Clostridia bacterium]
MKNTHKLIAMFIAVIMLTSCFTTIFSSTTFATHEDITVKFTADMDGNIDLSEDGKTLTYHYDDTTDFTIKLQKGKTEDLVLTKNPVETGGDEYTITNVESNEDIYIYCENMDHDKLIIRYSGEAVPIVEGYSPSLVNVDDVSNYHFRIEATAPNAGEGEGPQLGESYTVDFGTGAWTVDGVNVSAAIWGKSTIDGPVEVELNELIKLDGFNPDTMQITLEAEDGFKTQLHIVTTNSETSLESADAEGLPGGTLTFKVEKKASQNQEEPVEEPQGGEEAIEFDVEFTDTHMNFWINNLEVMTDGDRKFKERIQRRN